MMKSAEHRKVMQRRDVTIGVAIQPEVRRRRMRESGRTLREERCVQEVKVLEESLKR